jgi:hypothetical protein
VRRRMIHLAATVLAAVLCAGVLVSTGASASGPSLSLKASPRVVDFSKRTKLSGALSNRKKGVPLELEAKPFPFTGAFHQVGKTTTGKHGKFVFHKMQTTATRYFVELKNDSSVRSKTRTAYIDGHVSHLRCFLRRSGQSVKCGPNQGISGNWTLHVSYYETYPTSAYATETPKPVYVYYGQHNGSQKHPKTLKLKKQVSQHAIGFNTVKIAYAISVSLPANGYGFFAQSCTRDTESTNGFALPGHHHCGDSSITYRQATHYVG